MRIVNRISISALDIIGITIPHGRNSSLRKVQGQGILAICVDRMALTNLLQAIAHQKFVETGSKHGCWDVNKN